MKDLVYLSRSFVEFGPFTTKEVLDFQKRGLLADSDYLRGEGSDTWLHYQEWLTQVPAPEPKAEKKPAAPKAKVEKAAPVAAKPAPAKKAKKAA